MQKSFQNPALACSGRNQFQNPTLACSGLLAWLPSVCLSPIATPQCGSQDTAITVRPHNSGFRNFLPSISFFVITALTSPTPKRVHVDSLHLSLWISQLFPLTSILWGKSSGLQYRTFLNVDEYFYLRTVQVRVTMQAPTLDLGRLLLSYLHIGTFEKLGLYVSRKIKGKWDAQRTHIGILYIRDDLQPGEVMQMMWTIYYFDAT